MPGSTIAWALPSGGLWIGLPLGIAAIVLAARARRQPISRAGTRMAIGAIALAALAIGQIVAYTIVSVVAYPAAASAAKPRVSVTRDSAGIPHIVGKDFRSVGYGEGYAYAQDNLCTFADDVITLRAQRSKYFGPDALFYQYAGSGAADPNWKSDLWWKRVRYSRVVEKAAAQKPPLGPDADVEALYKGWAAGYNAYLRSGKLRDPACKGKPWVKPITLRDLYYRNEQIVTTPSSSRFISGLVDAQPPTGATARAATRGRPDTAALNRSVGSPASPLGSNGVGLGSDGTKNGAGMVLANPHSPWRGTERWWMAHLTVPGSYDVMGGTIGGFPAIGSGFNESLAWTHTVSTSRRFVVFKLELVSGDPTSYVVDGEPEKMGTQTVTAGGRTHTFYTTRYGVVFNLPSAGYFWTKDSAYAFGDVEEGNLRVANQYIKMGQARSVGKLLKVERRYLGIPTLTRSPPTAVVAPCTPTRVRSPTRPRPRSTTACPTQPRWSSSARRG